MTLVDERAAVPKPLYICILALLAACMAPVAADEVSVQSDRLPAIISDSDNWHPGPFRVEGRWHVTSPDKRFGGISSMRFDTASNRLVTVSDQGRWIIMDPASVSGFRGRATILPIPGRGGSDLVGKDGDAEGLARNPNDGSWLVSFERDHRVLSIPASFSEASVEIDLHVSGGPNVDEQPFNGGLEAITLLKGGGLLMISESMTGSIDNSRQAWLKDDDVMTPFSITVPDDIAVTDAATLPNGDILLLQRGFNQLFLTTEIIISMIKVEDIQDNIATNSDDEPVVIAAYALARFGAQGIQGRIDNMESIAIQRSNGNMHTVWIASDDNMNSSLQRTLFMKLRLDQRRARDWIR